MKKLVLRLPLFALALLLVMVAGATHPVTAETTANLGMCKELAFSTEEDFLMQGPTPPDGNPLISDGDLLNINHAVCMRNRDLLQKWDLDIDLGLDAVDVLDVERELVAFSTELNHPEKRFTAGDLLTTWGAEIPNLAMLLEFQVEGDRGLDAVHFVGRHESIIKFNEFAVDISRDEWLRDLGLLINTLQEYEVDIWISLEGTERLAATVPLYDGDLLSVATGQVVARNSFLLPGSVPAGLPNRGVDFGLDGFSALRVMRPERPVPLRGHFTTEILYRGEMAFSDGDVLLQQNGIVIPDTDLVKAFEPRADFLGTDALFIDIASQTDGYLPLILELWEGGER